MDEYLAAFTGGIIIGVATSILLLFKGRVFGISGVLGGIIKPDFKDLYWRLAILLGLCLSGACLYKFYPKAFPAASELSPIVAISAGLLVGFGTQLGSGCTSGHGVCGLSRFSVRSLVATLTFMFFGMVTVFVMSL